MATNEKDLKIKLIQEGLTNLVNDLQDVNDGMNDLADGADNAQTKSKSMFDTLTAAGAGIQGWIQTFQQVAGAVQAASAEYGRQTGIINNLQGSIAEASTRMQGMVANIDLMESRNRLASAGLQLTEHEFANLSVAAQRYAQTSGQEVNQVMDQLTQAISQGSAEQLQHFGLQLDNTTTKAHTQESALASLDEQYGTLTADASSAASGITQLSVALENAKTDFIEGTQAGGNYNTTINELNTSAQHLATSFGIDVSNGFSLANAAGEIFSMGLNSMVRAMARLMEAVNEFGNMNFSRAADAIASIGNIANEIAAESIVARTQADIEAIRRNVQTNIGATTTEGASNQPGGGRAAGGGGGGRNTGLMTAAAGQVAGREADQRALEEHYARQAAADAAHIAQQAFIQANLQREIELGAQLIQQQNEDNLAKKEALDLQEQSINNRQKEADAASRALLVQQEQVKNQTRYQQSIQGVNTFLNQGAAIAKTAHEQGRVAAKTQLKEWLKSFAISEALKGGMELAEGIANTIQNPPNAAAHYVSAGKHFALAAAAGGASAGVNAGGGGSGGGGGGSSAGTAGPKPSTGGAGGDSGSNGPKSIIINVNGPSVLTQAQVGREIQNALMAYQNRY